MFEKEAEEWRNSLNYEIDNDTFNNIVIPCIEFAYNKANEWHYVKDGDLPKYCEEVYFIFDENPNLVGSKIIGRSLGYYNELEKEWHGYYKGCPCRIQNVIAWKEIVLPELKESE